MAEEYIRQAAGDSVAVTSAGIEPGELDQHVVEVLKEDGIDISDKCTQSVFSLAAEGRQFDYVIAVCSAEAAEQCPVFPAEQKRLHWPFEDPSVQGGTPQERKDKIRSIRDRISNRCRHFVEDELEIAPVG